MADPNTPGRTVRHDLEGLRAVAVLGVVIYHLRASWLPGGFAGVDVFFVLSGYFITALLLRELDRTGRVDLLRFWGRRARRLLPASALVVVTTVLAGYVMTNALEAHRIAKDGAFSAVWAMNWQSAYKGTQYLDDPNPSPFVHFWSLGVEEQFYVVWPVLLFGLALLWRRFRPLTPRRTLFVLGLVGAIASFELALRQTVPANSYAYFGTPERVWQLAVGGLLAVSATRLARLPARLRDAARWLGLALIVAFYVGASTAIVYPGRKALIPVLGAALIVAAGEPLARRRDPVLGLLRSRPAQLGGRYSYSWYLWHYPPLVLLPIWLGHPLRIRELAACAVGTLLLAVLTYHLVENPIRTSRRLAVRRGGRSLALGALLVAVALGSAQLAAAAASHDATHTGITTASGARLVPQPAAAAKEQPRVYADGCIAGTNVDNLAKECRYLPDTGHGDVIEVGDSHAAMWFSGVYAIAREHRWGFRFWARNSCPFADVTKQVRGQYVVCDRWRADVVRRLVAAHPSLVLVASLDSTLPAMYVRDASGKPTRKLRGGIAGRAMWERGLERNLRILRAAGIHVLVIHDTPGYPHAMTGPDCVLTHPDDLEKCSQPRSKALPDGPSDLDAAKAVGGVSTIDYTPVFCSARTCRMVVGSTLAYRDYNHLTDEMIARLRPSLDALAVATMQGRVEHRTVARV